MNDHEQQHCESTANSLACYLAAVQGDHAGVALMLDSMTWLELRSVASAALHASADANKKAAPSQWQLERTIEILQAQLADLRAQATR